MRSLSYLLLSLTLAGCSTAKPLRGPASADLGSPEALLACAESLHDVNRWVVPFSLRGGKQQQFRHHYTPSDHRLLFSTGQGNRTILMVSRSGFYRVDLPYAKPKPHPLIDDRYYAVTGLPEGDFYMIRNLIRPESPPRAYHPKTEKEIARLGEPFVAVPASPEDMAEIQRLYLEKMGLLWSLVPDIKSPGVSAYASNKIKSTQHPTEEEFRLVEERCGVYF